jgi:hypothetical protein
MEGVAVLELPDRFVSGPDLATRLLAPDRPVRIYVAAQEDVLAALRGERPLAAAPAVAGTTSGRRTTRLAYAIPEALRDHPRLLLAAVLLDPADPAWADLDLDGRTRAELERGLAEGKLVLGYAYDRTALEPAPVLAGGRTYPFVLTAALPNVASTASWWNSSFGPAPQPDRGVSARRTANHGRIDLGQGQVLVNEQWNLRRGPDGLETRVYAKADGTFGWQWACRRADAVVAYPEVIFGQTPWQTAAGPGSSPPLRTTAALPVPVSAGRVRAEFDIATAARGTYDTSFDLWITDSPNPTTPARLTHEVMIWLDRKGTLFFPPGKLVGQTELGGVTYDVFVEPAQHAFTPYTWTLTVFLPRHPVMSGPLDLTAFLDDMVARGLLAPAGQFLASVELGTEVVQGSGTVEVSGYSIVVGP